MAKCSAHGSEVGTVHGLIAAHRYMSDGVVLKNNGSGWKRYAKIKPDSTPEEVFAAHLAKLNSKLAARPAWAQYRHLLHSATGLSKRWKLNYAISLMPDDYDGVWSEACDGYSDNVSASLEDIIELCHAYQAAVKESKSPRLVADGPPS